MINTYLNASLTLGEKFALSGEMLLRGMGTVFMVLIILYVILLIFGKAFSGSGKKNTDSKPAVQTVEPVHEEAPVPAAADDGALVAAITAAIEAYRAENEKTNSAFRVVSFRQKKSAGGWMGNDNQ